MKNKRRKMKNVKASNRKSEAVKWKENMKTK